MNTLKMTKIKKGFELITTIGFTPIKIPFLEVSGASPSNKLLTIVCGVHGDETSPQFVIENLLNKLKTIKVIGNIRIILAANPLSFLEKRRVTIIDNLDINRIFPGEKNKSISHKTANTLINLLSTSNFVIDLHTFNLNTPLMGIVVNPKDNPVNVNLMNMFLPKQVWVIQSSSKKESQFDLSLGSALNDLKIPNIVAEMNSCEFISNQEIENCTQGILRVLQHTNIIENKQLNITKNNFNFFNRTSIFSSENGLFFPEKKPLDKVKIGDKLGRINSILTGVTHLIKSKKEGILMQIAHRKIVFPGDEIAAIGEILNLEGQ